MLVLSQRSAPSNKEFSPNISTFTEICLNLLIEPGNLGVSTFTKICPSDKEFSSQVLVLLQRPVPSDKEFSQSVSTFAKICPI